MLSQKMSITRPLQWYRLRGLLQLKTEFIRLSETEDQSCQSVPFVTTSVSFLHHLVQHVSMRVAQGVTTILLKTTHTQSVACAEHRIAILS
jgi:hypothetical protein